MTLNIWNNYFHAFTKRVQICHDNTSTATSTAGGMHTIQVLRLYDNILKQIETYHIIK